METGRIGDGETSVGQVAPVVGSLQEKETDRDRDSDGGGGKRRIRIHVGGLGESVTEEDLHRLFGGGGTVEGVDIIRTKGRSFAYVDFLPCSDNSLSKLFTTYNGCAWKGAKLRLHKANEHYLVRMKREWAQDSQQHNQQPLVPPPPQSHSQQLSNPAKQLRIFFPALRTVKSLPITGTGKHKYSFQRVQVPSLPINFCDCEEHSRSSDLASSASAAAAAAAHGINEQELNIMNTVMDKLFQSQIKDSHSHESKAALPNQQHHELDVATATDEDDNLIINLVSSNQEKEENISEFQELRARGTQASKEEGTSQNVIIAQENLNGPPKKKRKSQPVDYNIQHESEAPAPASKKNFPTYSKEFLGAELDVQQVSWSQKSSWRQLVGHKGSSAFSVSHVLTGTASSTDQLQPKSSSSEIPHYDGENQDLKSNGNLEGQLGEGEDVDGCVEPQSAKPVVVSNKSGRGASWLHQSSWTQLVNSNTDSSFSIQQIVPGVPFDRQSFPKQKGADAVGSTDSKLKEMAKQESEKLTRGGSSSLGLGKEGEVLLHGPEDTVVNNVGARAPDLEIIDPTPTETSTGNVGISETCSFMRSASSMKEWARIKAAISGSQKKKKVAN